MQDMSSSWYIAVLVLVVQEYFVYLQGWTCFGVEQLETRLVSLDSRCVSSLNEETRRQDKLLTHLLNDDITQVRGTGTGDIHLYLDLV